MQTTKTDYIQIRISKKEKEHFIKLARWKKLSLSGWILDRIRAEIPPIEINELYSKLKHASDSSYIFALLNDYFIKINEYQWANLVTQKPENLDSENLCYLASMIERTAELRGFKIPDWVKNVDSLWIPYFGSNVKKLRLHLLVNSPVSFKKRNIFIDSSIGERV
jgi:hypothetical protein